MTSQPVGLRAPLLAAEHMPQPAQSPWRHLLLHFIGDLAHHAWQRFWF